MQQVTIRNTFTGEVEEYSILTDEGKGHLFVNELSGKRRDVKERNIKRETGANKYAFLRKRLEAGELIERYDYEKLLAWERGAWYGATPGKDCNYELVTREVTPWVALDEKEK